MIDLKSSFTGVRAIVFGDAMLDRYLGGRAGRISPEAPVPVVTLEGEWSCPGGAGNVAALLAALGCEVTLASAVGGGPDGATLRRRLRECGVAELAFAEGPDVGVICKTRVLAGGHQQLLRLDRDGERRGFVQAAGELADLALPKVAAADAVVIADYDKGVLTPELIRRVVAESRRTGRPCVVDPKKTDLSVYAGATVLTPNVYEMERALGRCLGSESAIAEAAVEARQALGLDHMLITRGPDGMTLATADGVRHLPAEVREVADVTGAGDTVVAALAATLALGWAVDDACRLASVAAGIAVGRAGTYIVQVDELERSWQGQSPKVLGPEAARAVVDRARQQGRRVVFTNGCFDILHAGHLTCLTQARKLGDLLVVGLNSDASVRLNKGSSRPIIPEDQRAALLAGLSCVDLVVPFDELTPEELIVKLEPDVLVKGGDYDPATIAGADFVRSRGGRVLTIPLIDGLSTTNILAASRGR